ncbi:MAG: hypothetical protein FJX03_07525 [Alphaproteobacteria bacterium]|nr:hypothetical protein [Alphaproteobacteria bacterium]
MGDISQAYLTVKRIGGFFYKVSFPIFCCHISLIINILASDNGDRSEDRRYLPLNPVCKSPELISPVPFTRNPPPKQPATSAPLLRSFENFAALPVTAQSKLLGQWGITLENLKSKTYVKNINPDTLPPEG